MSMNVLCAVFVATISIPFGVPAVPAQSVDSGKIVGRITDTVHVALPGVEVSADADGVHRQAVTDTDGRYEIRELPIRVPYRLTFSLAGFRTKTVEAVLPPSDQSV